jgi:FkbM family methyltransferase
MLFFVSASLMVKLAVDQTLSVARGNALSRLENVRSVDELIAGVSEHNNGLDPRRFSQIAIVGAAPEGQRLAKICRQHGIRIAALVDDDPAKVGTSVDGTIVGPSSRLDALEPTVPVIIASHRVLGAILRLRASGHSVVFPVAALQILAPEIFKPQMFYDGWLQDLVDNKQQYGDLNAGLADDRSRKVLDAVLCYRLTADPEFLEPVIDSGRYHQGLYHPAGVFECDDHEVYIDAGAFDGDSLKWFKDRVGGRFDRIVAFEPDPTTYARLAKNFAGEDRIETVNAGLHRTKAVLRFRDDASRGAIFTEDGEIAMDVVGLDEFLAGDRATFIKMNIEGAEIDALYGAQDTIRQWLPKLAISVYHRPSDLWRIPAIVRDFSAEYELFLRQHDGGVIETVLYAVPRPRLAA